MLPPFTVVIRCILLYALLISVCLSDAVAQTKGDSTSEPEPLDLFDGNAETTELGWPQLSVSVGYMTLEADGHYIIELPSGRRVTVLDLDRIGLDNSDSSMWLTANWRSRSSRWGAWFGYWGFDASGYRVWQEDLPIGGGIPVGAALTSEMKADWYILEATYSFVRTEKVDFGIGAGFHAVDLDFRINGRVQVGEREGDIINENIGALAPLPNILGYFHWKFAPRWTLTTRFGWFDLSYGDFDGKMTNMHTLVRFDMSKRWALEAGYQFVNLELDIDEGLFTSVYDVDFNGPMGVLRFKF